MDGLFWPYSELLDTFSIFSVWSGHWLVCHLALSAVMSHHLSQHKTSNSAPLARFCPGSTIPWIKVIAVVGYYSSAFCSHFFLLSCVISLRSLCPLSPSASFASFFQPFSEYLSKSVPHPFLPLFPSPFFSLPYRL